MFQLSDFDISGLLSYDTQQSLLDRRRLAKDEGFILVELIALKEMNDLLSERSRLKNGNENRVECSESLKVANKWGGKRGNKVLKASSRSCLQCSINLLRSLSCSVIVFYDIKKVWKIYTIIGV